MKNVKMKNAGMRKAIVVMLGGILLTVSAAGCLAPGENAEPTELTIGAETAAEESTAFADETMEATVSAPEEQSPAGAADDADGMGQTVSLETIEQWSGKGSALTVSDFEPYMEFDLETLRGGTEEEQIPFLYGDASYYLRVIAEGGAEAASLDECRLVSAVVFPEEFLQLRSWEDEYEFDGACADIRSGNLEHILNGEVQMADYMSCELPEGVVCSGFKHWLGTRGGVAFINAEADEGELTIENAGFYAAKQGEAPALGGMEIFGVGEIQQSMTVLDSYPDLESDDNIVVSRERVQVDGGYTWYLARGQKEGASIEYCLYLNAEQYTLEEFEEMTDTIQFQENAFY